MSQGKESSTGKVLMGFIFGVIAGAAAAFLLTPKSGVEMRRNINRQTISLKKKSSDFANIAKEKSSNLAKNVSDSKVINKVKDRAMKQPSKDRKDEASLRVVPKDYDESNIYQENDE